MIYKVMCLLLLMVLLISLADNVVKRKHKSAHRVVMKRQVVSLDDDRLFEVTLYYQVQLYMSPTKDNLDKLELHFKEVKSWQIPKSSLKFPSKMFKNYQNNVCYFLLDT